MTPPKPLGLVGGVTVGLLALVLAAGCGSSASAQAPKAANGKAATVGVASTNLGDVLVNSAGRTLYLFQKDTGTQSACTSACAAAWPPLLDKGKATVGSGADASKLGTTTRSDGTVQVTYNGHPLYLYVGDTKAGDTTGQGSTGFGAPWYALSPTGSAVTAQGSNGGGGASGY
jgi:predicted lipoprotein with Yx(FWY)xxD motif